MAEGNQNRNVNAFNDDIPDPVVDDNDLEVDDSRHEMGYVGQIVQPGDIDIDDVDDESTVVATDEGFAGYESQPAEEAAMHTIDE